MEMEENAELNQSIEEDGSLSGAELLDLVCSALKKATGGDPERLNNLIEKLEQIVQLNTEGSQVLPSIGEGECKQEKRHLRAG